MRSILLMPLVARFIETMNVCIWRMFVFMSVVVIVWEVCCVSGVMLLMIVDFFHMILLVLI